MATYAPNAKVSKCWYLLYAWLIQHNGEVSSVARILRRQGGEQGSRAEGPWAPTAPRGDECGRGVGPLLRKFLNFLNENGVFMCTLEHCF